MKELFINGIRIELIERTVSITYQVNDIGDVRTRQANFSNNIKIPQTKNNIKTLEFLGVIGTETRIPYKELSIKYVIDGQELITKGKGIIKNTNKFFNLIIYDGNISMTELLGDKELKTLDFSAHNHILTEQIFIDSFIKIDGYTYALGEFFKESTFFSVITIDLSSPSMFMHTLFSMIFEQKGFTISGDFLTDEDFKNRLIANNNGYDRFTTSNKVLKQTFDTGTLPQFSETFGTTPTTKLFEIDSYTAVKTIAHTINFNGSLSINAGKNEKIVFEVNNVNIGSIDFPVSPFDFESTIQLRNNDVLKIFVSMDSTPVVATETIQFSTDFIDTIFENELCIDIDFTKLIGEERQIDFVKDVMQRYGLYFVQTPFENNFEFKRIKDVLIDRANAEDWSDKAPLVINEVDKPNYAQINKFKYKYDDNDTNTEQIFADGELLLDNVNLAFSKTVVTSIHKASTLTRSGFQKLKHWVIDEEEIVINNDGIRMFKLINNVGSFRYRFNDDITGTTTFVGTFPMLDFNSINYQKEINNNYLEFESLLNDFKLLKIELDLSIIDILQLDFFRLKYFDQLGQYYYLNKVLSFKKDKITKVELIQIGKDVIDPLAMIGTSTGESVADSTLTKLLFGAMNGISIGESVVNSTLTKIPAVTLQDFSTSTTGTSVLSVCSKALDIIRYHDGAGALPVNGDIVFNDSDGTSLFNGSNLFYKVDPKGIQISTIGVVSNSFNC